MRDPARRQIEVAHRSGPTLRPMLHSEDLHQEHEVIMTKGAKRRIAATIIAMLGAVACGSGAAAERKFQKLTGPQIQATFAGMELTDESHWGDVFKPNGTLAIYGMGHKSIGKWRVQKDQLCLDHGPELGGGCYEVWLSGKNVELRNQASSVPLEGVLQKPTDQW